LSRTHNRKELTEFAPSRNRILSVIDDGAAAVASDEALRSGEPPVEFAEELRIAVDKYSQPLNDSSDPRQWWIDHRPVLIQTAALGPLDHNQRIQLPSPSARPLPTFQGCRIARVERNSISRIDYLTVSELRQRVASAIVGNP
jgi:hypothetical protein